MPEAACSRSEKRVLAKHYLDQGLSQAAAADLLGVTRRTLHRWRQQGLLDGPVPERKYVRKPQPTKLDPYKSIIEERLTAYPELSAVRLLEEVRAAGYVGGYTQLQAYVQKVRPTPPAEPVVRFETPPWQAGAGGLREVRLPWRQTWAELTKD
jgi:transposase